MTRPPDESLESDYDRHADVYDAWSVTDHPYRAIEAFTFMKVVGPVQGLDILDLGSGEGRTCRTFVERGARSVIGTDVSPEMIRASEKNAAEDGTPVYPQLRFDVVDARDDAFALTTRSTW